MWNDTIADKLQKWVAGCFSPLLSHFPQNAWVCSLCVALLAWHLCKFYLAVPYVKWAEKIFLHKVLEIVYYNFKMICGKKIQIFVTLRVGVHPFLSPCIYLPMIRLRQLSSSCRIFVTRELMMVLSFECMVLFIILSHNAATQSKCWSNSILNVEFR